MIIHARARVQNVFIPEKKTNIRLVRWDPGASVVVVSVLTWALIAIPNTHKPPAAIMSLGGVLWCFLSRLFQLPYSHLATGVQSYSSS